MICGRILGLEVPTITLPLEFSPEAWWRLGELVEDTDTVSRSALIHKTRHMQDRLEDAYDKGFRKLQLVTAGRTWEADLAELLGRKQLSLPF